MRKIKHFDVVALLLSSTPTWVKKNENINKPFQISAFVLSSPMWYFRMYREEAPCTCASCVTLFTGPNDITPALLTFKLSESNKPRLKCVNVSFWYSYSSTCPSSKPRKCSVCSRSARTGQRWPPGVAALAVEVKCTVGPSAEPTIALLRFARMAAASVMWLLPSAATCTPFSPAATDECHQVLRFRFLRPGLGRYRGR